MDSGLDELFNQIEFELVECKCIDEEHMGGHRTTKLLQVLDILRAVKSLAPGQLSVVLETTGDIDHVDDDDFI